MVTTVNRCLKYQQRRIPPDGVSLSDIPKEEFKEGWLSSYKYVPENYELVALKKDFLSKPVSGWRCGANWEGLRVNKNKKYSYWMFMKEVE